VNKKNPNKKIGHWILLLRPTLEKIEVFDSLGSSKKNLYAFRIYGKRLVFNQTRVQARGTKTCGLFCLYVAFFRLIDLDLPFSKILNSIFKTDMNQNERKVQEFESKYLKK
jgi:hypothetical protein